MWWRLFWWVISYALSDYFRERLPAQTASGLGDFNVPTATEGRSVPIIIGGSPKCRSMNCIWYGDFEAIARTVTTGVIFKEEEVIGFTYHLALCYAIAKTEVAGITAIWIGDDRVWDYVADNGGVPKTDFVDVDANDIFGGIDDGGGFVGRIRLFRGTETQGVSAFMNSRVADLPAYRGTTYIMVTSLDETQGANIGEAPNLRYISVEVQAFDTVANGGMGDVMNLGNNHHFIGRDANPVSVAFDLYTNPRWGRGFAAGEMNLSNFQAVAEVVYSEGIGFTQLIDEGTTTGEIQDTLEQHMDCYIGPNPITGKIEIKLARFDYTLGNEFQANESNIIEVTKWNKGDWSQTFNRVRLRYSDRNKEWNETHAVAIAPGNRIIQGKTVTKEVRYQGVHDATVANKIAARELKNLAQPSASGNIRIDRTSYALRPGDVFSFTNTNAGESNLAVRITRAGVGNTIDNQMDFDVTSDIFDTELANVAAPPPTDFVPPIQAVIPFDTADQAATESPFILMRQNPLPTLVPRVATLARRGVGNSPTQYEVIRRVRNPPTAFSGVYTSTDFVTAGFMTVGALRNNEIGWQTGNGALTIQVDPLGVESLDALIGAYDPEGSDNMGGVCVISPGLDDEEWIACDSIVDDGTGIRLEGLYRACMDTPMKAHVAGARVWFIWTGGLGMGEETYNNEDGVQIKLLPRNNQASVLEPAATALPEVIIGGPSATIGSGRSTKPLVPYTLNLNASVFPTVVDFDRLITQGANSGLAGVEGLPTHRAFNTENIIDSVTGKYITGLALTAPDVVALGLEQQVWIHNLDNNALAVRTISATTGMLAQATPSDYFDILKSAVVAAGAEGFSFNARIEIETRHSPAGQVALQLSREPMEFDFTAVGAFSVLNDAPLVQLHFDGADASTVIADHSQYRRYVQAGGTAQLDTAQSVFGGSSLLVNGTSDYIVTPTRREWDVRADFTMEFRVRFTSETGFPMIFEQWDATPERSLQVYYEPASNRWLYNYSTTAANLVTGAWHSGGTFIPTLGVWYEIALVRKGTQWSCYIDGVKLGADNTNAAVIFRSSLDFRIGGGGDATNWLDGWLDEFRITPFALYSATYTPATKAFSDARALYPLLCHFDDTDAVITTVSDDLNKLTIDFTGTSAIDTAQFKFGTASALFNGVNNFNTPALQDGATIAETVSAAHPAFDFKRDDFTIEGFFRLNALPSTNPAEGAGFALIAKAHRGTSGGFDWFIGLNSTNTNFYFSRSPTGSLGGQALDAVIPTLTVDGAWHHFAVVRIGNDLHLYYDGNRVGITVGFFDTNPDMWNNDSPQGGLNKVTIGYLGGFGSASSSRKRAFNGWIDEVNIEKEARYNGSTYTVPTAPRDPGFHEGLTKIDDDLILQISGEGPSNNYATSWTLRSDDLSGRWLGYGGNARHILPGPAGTWGTGALFTDGNGDYTQVSRSESQGLEGDDFTIEGRIWFTNAPTTLGGRALISNWRATGNQRGFFIAIEDSNELAFHWSTNGTDDKKVFCPFTPAISTWYYITVVRNGGNVHLFIDGVLQTNDGASDAITADVIYNPLRAIHLGLADDTAGTHYHNGYIQAIRIKRGALWTGTFTPPTGLYSAPTLPRIG